MGMTAEDYAKLLKGLAPQGFAWPTDPNATFNKLLDGLAIEFSRLDSRAEILLIESDPRTTSELLIDWEKDLGLPDTCTGLAPTLQQRRGAIVAKLIGIGKQTVQYYLDLLAFYGYTVTITQFQPFRCGINACGQELIGQNWAYYFRINAPETSLIYFTAGISSAGEPLRTWGNDTLECLVNEYKPAHTVPIFAYSS
jgi:uncharacterized protein YmfQ (DUF2313 family)